MFNSICVKATEVNRHTLRSPEEELKQPSFSSPKLAISPPDGHKFAVKELLVSWSALAQSTETTEVRVCCCPGEVFSGWVNPRTRQHRPLEDSSSTVGRLKKEA